MNKGELIGKLQMVYVGDKNALNELICYYAILKRGIDELQQENQELKKDIKNIIRTLNKNCDDLEATEEEFESLERWNK